MAHQGKNHNLLFLELKGNVIIDPSDIKIIFGKTNSIYRVNV